MEDNNSNNQYLKQLNKLSHKISKPPITASSAAFRKPPPPPPEQPQPPQLGPQPPVYNINKSDFRDIVQKLTGSPAHSPVPGPGPGPTPPPPNMVGPSKPSTTSRLHRIRPPPLSQLTNRPPPPPFFNPNPLGGFGFRPTSGGPPPLSPLPPLPSVHAAAESPVSAYMRFLRSSSGAGFSEPTRQFSPLAPPLVSPRWNADGGMFPPLPSSPLPFGCMSPTAASYPPLLSPTAFPLSPTVPISSSPKGRGL